MDGPDHPELDSFNPTVGFWIQLGPYPIHVDPNPLSSLMLFYFLLKSFNWFLNTFDLLLIQKNDFKLDFNSGKFPENPEKSQIIMIN
jgi:hypothetical protein